MCLAVPAQVVNIINEFTVEVETFGNRAQVNTTLVDNIQLGDYVLVHAGMAIEIVDRQSAEESMHLWRDLYVTPF